MGLNITHTHTFALFWGCNFSFSALNVDNPLLASVPHDLEEEHVGIHKVFALFKKK